MGCCCSKASKSGTDEPLPTDEIVNRALEKVFLGFDFHHSKEGTETEQGTYILEFVNNSSEIYPDQTGDHLRHGLLSSQFHLHQGSTPTQYVFEYRWIAKGRTYLTSPYYERNMTNDSLIPCRTVDITDALKGSHPVKAVEIVLRSQPTIFTVDQFKWVWRGIPMTDFTLKALNSQNLYWKGVRGSKVDVYITEKTADKAILKLVSVQDPITRHH